VPTRVQALAVPPELDHCVGLHVAVLPIIVVEVHAPALPILVLILQQQQLIL
jgi:hypothetical protein